MVLATWFPTNLSFYPWRDLVQLFLCMLFIVLFIYNPLSPFSAAHTHVLITDRLELVQFSGCSSQEEIDYLSQQPLVACSSSSSGEVLWKHLSSMLACQLVLGSCVGNHIVHVSCVQPSYHVKKMLCRCRDPDPLTLITFLSFLPWFSQKANSSGENLCLILQT